MTKYGIVAFVGIHILRWTKFQAFDPGSCEDNYIVSFANNYSYSLYENSYLDSIYNWSPT